MSTSLLPWLTGRYEEHPIEAELMECAFGGVEMSDVDRIECSAEDSGSHVDEDRAAEEAASAALW